MRMFDCRFFRRASLHHDPAQKCDAGICAYPTESKGHCPKCVRLNVESFDPRALLVVIAGLDPAIQKLAGGLDCRVKPGNDTKGALVVRSRWTWGRSLGSTTSRDKGSDHRKDAKAQRCRVLHPAARHIGPEKQKRGRSPRRYPISLPRSHAETRFLRAFAASRFNPFSSTPAWPRSPALCVSLCLCASVVQGSRHCRPLDMGSIARFGLTPPRARPSSSSTRNAAPRPDAGSDGWHAPPAPPRRSRRGSA
jgi:hypothetical protein